MNIIRKELRLLTHRETVELVFLGDIHLGHINSNKEYLDSVINYIKSHNRCFWLGMGDYMDSITVSDRRFNWDSIDLSLKTPNDQYQKLIEMFRPIRTKCLGLLTGNHEYSLWNDQKSFDYINGLCAALSDDDYQVPYGTYDAVFLLDFLREKDIGEKIVRIYAHHGWTSGRTEGGISTRMSDMINIFPGLDIYAMGHVHRLGAMPLLQQLEIGRVNGKDDVISRNVYRVLTGGFLKGYEPKQTSYIEMKTYPPSGIGSPILRIQPFHDGRNGEFLKVEFGVLPDDLP